MKKTYLAKRNALLSPAGLSLGAVALAIALLALFARVFFPGPYLSITAPIMRAGSSLSSGVAGMMTVFADKQSLVRDAEGLADQNRALADENRALTEKVASLSALLGGSSGAPAGSGIVTEVIARPPVSPYDTLVVGKGSDAGVALNMEAFGNGGVPLGVVTSVTRSFSRVTLFSAPGETLSAWVGSAHAPVTLGGSGAGAFSASVPRAANIAVGDAVYAPGQGAVPIGIVRRIDGAPAAPSVDLRIAPAANPFSLTNVVLRDSGSALLGALSCATSTP